MKIIKGKTTFEFTEEEIKAIRTCYNLFDEIYTEMEENETFCGYYDSNLDNEVLHLFSRMISEIDENKDRKIICK